METLIKTADGRYLVFGYMLTGEAHFEVIDGKKSRRVYEGKKDICLDFVEQYDKAKASRQRD